jgi:hypothetical protein
MKKRIINWWNHLLWNYSTPIHKIVELESTRYLKYLNNAYSVDEQLFIVKKLTNEIIQLREDQIKNKHLDILEEKENLAKLESNLLKLKSLYREE